MNLFVKHGQEFFNKTANTASLTLLALCIVSLVVQFDKLEPQPVVNLKRVDVAANLTGNIWKHMTRPKHHVELEQICCNLVHHDRLLGG